jgi:hypothetical protein
MCPQRAQFIVDDYYLKNMIGEAETRFLINHFFLIIKHVIHTDVIFPTITSGKNKENVEVRKSGQ